MENLQIPLIADTYRTALDAVIVALGGAKRAGALLWPDKDPADAGRALMHALDDARRENLTGQQLVLLLAEARKVGCHTAMAYIDHVCGYADPQPLEPETERAALMREFNEQAKALRALMTRMDRAGLRVA